MKKLFIIITMLLALMSCTTMTDNAPIAEAAPATTYCYQLKYCIDNQWITLTFLDDCCDKYCKLMDIPPIEEIHTELDIAKLNAGMSRTQRAKIDTSVRESKIYYHLRFEIDNQWIELRFYDKDNLNRFLNLMNIQGEPQTHHELCVSDFLTVLGRARRAKIMIISRTA